MNINNNTQYKNDNLSQTNVDINKNNDVGYYKTLGLGNNKSSTQI